MPFRRAVPLRDLWSGESVGLLLDGRKVLLVNMDGAIYAYEDKCAHLGVPLSEGRFAGGVLTCRAHEWQYDVCTGRGINPEGVRLNALPVKVEDGEIVVDVGPYKNA